MFRHAVELEVIKEGAWSESNTNVQDVKPPMLLLHGYPDSPAMYDDVASHFVSKGRRVARVAWPNCGSKPEIPWGASFDDLLASLVDVAEKIGPADVIAHDWGAMMAWLLEKKRPELVHSLVAVDVGQEVPKDLKSNALILAYQIPLLIAFLLAGKFKGFADGIVRAVASVFQRPHIRADLTSLKGYWYYYFWHDFLLKKGKGWTSLLSGKSKRLPTCPTLYIYGAKKFVKFHSEEWLNKMKRRQDCKVVKMEHTGHWVFNEDPQGFLQHVDAFYEAVDRSE